MRVDLVLQVGEVDETVVVAGAAPLVRTETSSLEQVVQNREILELPLNRNASFTQLAALSAGVSSRNRGGLGYQKDNLVFGGARARDNDFRIDGIRAMESHNADITVRPPLDSIQEFQLVRHQYSAEHGRAMGAIIEVRTKSGTNSFHGSVYEFARRGSWSAIPYFARTKPTYVEDRYGGSIGGPIRLPGAYDGRDKSFFFLAYEKFKSPSQRVARHYSLTAAERAGDFSDSVWAATDGPPRNPFTGESFPNSMVPASFFSPATDRMLQIIPGPTGDFDGVGNWTGNLPNDDETPYWIIRVDHSVAENHSLFGSVLWSRRYKIYTEGIDAGESGRIGMFDQNEDDIATILGYRWTVSPKVVLESRAGYTYHDQSWNAQDKSTNWAQDWGFDFHPRDDLAHLHGVPRVTVSGFGRLFGFWGTPLNRRLSYLYNVANIVSINQGDHYLKVGVDVVQDRIRGIGGCGSTGQYWTTTPRGSGDRGARFRMGQWDFAGFQFTPGWSKAKRWQTAYFVQDDWKVSPKLTLNLGLRYDYVPPYSSMNCRVARYDLRADHVIYPECLQSQLSAEAREGFLFPHVFQGPPKSYVGEHKTDLAPRFGLAYRPFGGSDMVVRAGYGLFYSSPQGYAVVRNWKTAPWSAWLTISAPPRAMFGSSEARFYHGPYDESVPAVATFINTGGNVVEYLKPGDIRMPEDGFHNAYAQHWNVTIQKALTNDTALELAYAGTRGVHLDFEWRARKFAALYGVTDFFLEQNLRLSTSGGDSKYHALQATLHKRYSRGISFRANYTWGKLMTDLPSERFDAGGSFDYLRQKHLEWGRGDADVTHNFNLSGIFGLPIGRNRTWGTNMARGLDAVVGGWALTLIFDATSGQAFSPTGVFGGGLRPDAVRDPNTSSRTRERWFDPSAFQDPDCELCLGNAGRNTIDGPNFWNLDVGIFKAFTFKESHRLEARVELFNAFNHPNFMSMITNITNPAAGLLTSPAAMRQVQLAFRYSF